MSQIYSAFFLTLYIHHIIVLKIAKIFWLLPFYYLKVPYLAGTNFGFGNITAKTKKNFGNKTTFSTITIQQELTFF